MQVHVKDSRLLVKEVVVDGTHFQTILPGSEKRGPVGNTVEKYRCRPGLLVIFIISAEDIRQGRKYIFL